MKTYVLNRDWAPFSKGELFKDCCGNGLYNLNSNEDVFIKIPDEYLDEKNHAWQPSHDEVYYFIDDDTAVEATDFYDGDHDDKGRLAIGNCFETDEEGRRMLDWLKARQNLINSGAEFTNDIDVAKPRYGVWYHKSGGRLGTYCRISSSSDCLRDKGLCFDSEKLALDSIERCKEDWLVYLGVKENKEANNE